MKVKILIGLVIGALAGATVGSTRAQTVAEGPGGIQCSIDTASSSDLALIETQTFAPVAGEAGTMDPRVALGHFLADRDYKVRRSDFRIEDTGVPDSVRLVYEPNGIRTASAVITKAQNGWVLSEMAACDSVT